MQSVSDVDFRQALFACVTNVRRTFADHVPLYICAAAFALVTAAVVVDYHLSFPLSSGIFFLNNILQAIALVWSVAALRQLLLLYRTDRSNSPVAALCRQTVMVLMRGDRVGNITHGLAVFTPLMMIFTALKIDIVGIHPFAWDHTLMLIDRTIGLGTAPWQILQPALGYPPLTTLFCFAYGGWFFAMFGCLFWQLTRPRADALRSQFLLAFAIAWFFSGFVLATLFSSVGPCFYAHVVHGPDPYAPLMQYLRHTREHWPILTQDAQDELWRAYLTGKGDVQGISAMPSMHVTIATLLAFLGWRTDRYLGIALTVFAITIFLGSIMLGWHYAVDGIAGAALAGAFWIVAGRITVMWDAYRARLVPPGALLGAPVLE